MREKYSYNHYIYLFHVLQRHIYEPFGHQTSLGMTMNTLRSHTQPKPAHILNEYFKVLFYTITPFLFTVI